MFAVPEVDDDITASSTTTTTVDNTKLSTQPEGTTEILSTVPSPPSPPPAPTSTSETPVTNDETTPVKTEVQSSPASGRQHLSRISLFQRNTIHVCDQISDHM